MKSHRLPAFASITLILLVLLAMPAGPVLSAPLDPTTQPKYVNQLPIPGRIDMTRGNPNLQMEMREVVQNLGLVDGAGNPLPTTVWGYGKPGQVTYPGPTIVAKQNRRINVRVDNNLPPYDVNAGQHLLPMDTSFHRAMPTGVGVPACVHLHGGHTEWQSDGLPEQWYTPGYASKGADWQKMWLRYDNDQDAATLWYHDHALGITRLNTYAGLAGFYLLKDSQEQKLVQNRVLPADPYDIEIVIQDRVFNDDGSLAFPSEDPELMDGDWLPLPAGPSIIAEFFGDVILVNGAPWPVLHVEPRQYRFRFLNGSDSRFYILEARDEPTGPGVNFPFLVVGTDQGRLDRAIAQSQLLIAPGERYEVIADFTYSPPGSDIFIRNFGSDGPFKGFNPDGTLTDGEGGVVPAADEATTGQIMEIIVDKPLNRRIKNSNCAAGTKLNKRTTDRLVQNGPTRPLVLFEGADEYGRLMPMLGTLAGGSFTYGDPITENVLRNDTEMWEIYNTTADAHPIHLHLVKFQLVNRESYTGTVTEKEQPVHGGHVGMGGILTVDALGGDVRGPAGSDLGWQDTIIMYPGEVTRVIATFDLAGKYVWHCHILSHEEHDMMRSFMVQNTVARGGVDVAGSEAAATDAVAEPAGKLTGGIDRLSAEGLQIRFDLPRADRVEVAVFDVTGRRVRSLGNRTYGAGSTTLVWDGRTESGSLAPSGVYFVRIMAPNETVDLKGVLVR